MRNRGCCLTKTKVVFIYLIVNLLISLIPNISHSVECIDSVSLLEIKPDVDQPSDIAVGPNGDLYLVDGVNHRVIVLSGRGEWKFSFGQKGVGQGELKFPLGIDVSAEGKVFIADTGNHRIQLFDLNGNFLRMFTVNPAAGEKPADPVDVLASKLKDYVYVSDNDNHNIKVFSQSGKFQFQWGRFGEGPGEFRYPAMLALNEYNEVYVVDVLNTRVQKFDPFGKHITDIGSWGVLPGKLFRPKGVAIDKKNRVFVSDSYMGLIEVFTDLGRFLGVVCENRKKKTISYACGTFFS
jgi:DNA-binding beta-propeller fold protein YncE